MKQISAYANANIALVKYWGKNDSGLNIPAVSSLSMTLADHGTQVFIAPSATSQHELLMDTKALAKSAHDRLAAYLEAVRARYSFGHYFRIDSKSSIPFASGLASSASFFAALACALNEMLALKLSSQELSCLARMGSGSAARSIFGGFVGLHGGHDLRDDDAFAFPLVVHPSLKLHLVVAVVDDTPKPISSRDAMKMSMASPLYQGFVASHREDFLGAQQALGDGAFARLGEIMEHSTLKMFATMWSTRPAIMYWRPQSLALIEAIYDLRRAHGPIAYFTMDAGPNVKVLCEEDALPLVLRTIAERSVTKNIFCVAPGGAVHVVR